MVPKGWQKYAVGELCASIVPGRNKPKVFDGDIPWVTTPEINGRYIPSNLQVNYVSTTALSDAGGKIVPKGAVVMAAVGELGLIAITSEPVVLNQQLHAFVCSKLVNNEFLAYWLTTQKPYMESIASKTTIPYMNKTNCESIPVLLPPLAEQFKIAQILIAWDKAIVVTEKLLTNSQQQKKALTQQLLTGKKRLLDEDGVRFSGEWVHGQLGDLCAFKGGFAFKEVYQGQSMGELPFIKVSDMNLLGNERNIEYSNNWVSFETAKLMKAKPFPESSIVFAKVGAALLLNRRRILLRPTIIDNNMMAAVPSNAADTEFLYQLLMAIDFARFVQEGAVPSINQGDLSSFKLSYPYVEEQPKIAAVLSAADAEISTLEKKLACLKDEKKALMQQLLTGKRRVKVDAEEAVSA
ncbi:restriction endonuclease subunit S [Enterobacter hormaechei]|uniref:restriction endonuclease subunit S n=1 Tax=Enterobacter hormaechei TaxID=158836 RepID=UPI001E28A76F|nr:restriction endonuclease subunit S [Enterobacter hormaechei]MCC4569992.1 restriction endonuclease subunit S [Enterobacter hormaechei subsp. hoffmannii]MCC4573899.1 restriction endonuclease subunit S [Enterobacter hormaechei subsp. hoffmannii]MCC4578444.1 restriction endonuclease subunit S [Enterobacter hormaechei subsp. hoffmannii]MCC4583628.1 restriction endonuclease subunit S [Enterobacter hormaechei subsp. hoffmannii]MCE1613821.1 restriction endonuclease subunit S [Enterobacter hormaeche